MSKITKDPHDPGAGDGRQRAEEAGDAARRPFRIGDGLVRSGIASWTDATMTVPGVFYPKGANTAEERLRYYADQFPVVEVDATYYVLPSRRTAESWVERTPKDFVFDVKAHALMTGQPTEVARLPKAIKEELGTELAEKKRIYRKDLPTELLDAVYEQFRDAIEPLVEAGKLGAVFVQFPKWVFPSNEARELILETRRRPDPPIAGGIRRGRRVKEEKRER